MIQEKIQSLCENYLGSPVKISEVSGDISKKKFWRARGEKKSAIVMELPANETQRWTNCGKLIETFQEGLVPKVFTSTQNLLLIEDLGDINLQKLYTKGHHQEKALEYYDLTMNFLVNMAKKTHQSTAFDKDTGNPPFTSEFFTKELSFFYEQLQIFLNTKFSESDDKIFLSESKFLCEQIDLIPTSLQHRDFHSRNILIHQNKIRLIDFQDLRRGPALYDLVSLTLDPYTGLTPNFKNILWNEFYHSTFIRKKIEKERFIKLCSLMGAQRTLKACGSFLKAYNEDNNSNFLKYTLPCFQTTLSILEQAPRFQKMLNHLTALSPSLQGAVLSKL